MSINKYIYTTCLQTDIVYPQYNVCLLTDIVYPQYNAFLLTNISTI